MTRLKTIFLPVLLFAMACTGDSTGKPSQNGPDGPGSGGTTLPEGTVSITDFRAAVAGGDWHKAFTEAFRVADRILVPDGEYPLSPLMVPSGKTIEGAGAGTVFTPLGSILFRVEGSAGDEIPVVSHIPDFSSAIEVASFRLFFRRTAHGPFGGRQYRNDRRNNSFSLLSQRCISGNGESGL